jgi:hypothetical protein
VVRKGESRRASDADARVQLKLRVGCAADAGVADAAGGEVIVERAEVGQARRGAPWGCGSATGGGGGGGGGARGVRERGQQNGRERLEGDGCAGGADYTRRVGVRACRRLRRSGGVGRAGARRAEGECGGGGDEGLCCCGRILRAPAEAGAGQVSRDKPCAWPRKQSRERRRRRHVWEVSGVADRRPGAAPGEASEGSACECAGGGSIGGAQD